MSQVRASDPVSAEQQDLAFRTRRILLLFAAFQWVFIGGLVASTTSLPVAMPAAIAIIGAGYSFALVYHYERQGRAQLADPITGELSISGRRLPLSRGVWARVALSCAAEVAVLALLIASHAYAHESCARAGISRTTAAREGKCVSYAGLLGQKTVYNVVDAGHVLRMPGYDVQLRATSVAPTGVTNSETDPQAYPGGRGLLVSFQVSVTNRSSTPLAFDAEGRDVELLLNNLDGPTSEISFPDLPHANGQPGAAIADTGPIAPRGVSTGWVSFVAPIWAEEVVNKRPADLEFYRPGNKGGYTGQIRLWRSANAEGRIALSYR